MLRVGGRGGEGEEVVEGGEGEEVVEASGGGGGSGGKGKCEREDVFLVPELKVLMSCWP